MSPKLNCVDETNKIWLPWQRPFRDRKTNHIHGSSNPENLKKIGQVNVEITGLTEIVKIGLYKKQQHNIWPPCLLRSSSLVG